jgi:hypothetical protein
VNSCPLFYNEIREKSRALEKFKKSLSTEKKFRLCFRKTKNGTFFICDTYDAGKVRLPSEDLSYKPLRFSFSPAKDYCKA